MQFFTGKLHLFFLSTFCFGKDISVKNVETSYTKDHEYSLECHVDETPSAVVWWKWKPCKQMPECPLGADDWTDVDNNGTSLNEEYMTEIPGGKSPTSVVSYLNVTARQSGHYMCVANNTKGKYEHLIDFIVTGKPNVFIKNLEEAPEKDQEYSLECLVEGYPPAVVRWKWKPCKQIYACSSGNGNWVDVDNNSSSRNEEHMMESLVGNSTTSVVSYLNVTARQSGHYMCVANNTMGTNDAVIAFFVTGPERSTCVYFYNWFQFPLVRESGSTTSFSIVAAAFPNISIFEQLYWEKNGKLINSDSHYDISRLNTYKSNSDDGTTSLTSVLKINGVQRSDAATYTLCARTEEGTYCRPISFEVEDVPEVSIKSLEMFYAKDQEYSLDCHIESYPPGDIWWLWKPCKQSRGCSHGFHDDWLDVNNDGNSSNEEFIMQITGKSPKYVVSYLNVTARQSGYYMCNAENKRGEVEHFVPFLVTDPEPPTQVFFTTDVTLSKPVVYEPGDYIEFAITVNAFPNISLVELYFEKNGEFLKSDDHLNVNVTQVAEDNRSIITQLDIYEAQRSDAANYTLYGKTKDEIFSISILLEVKDKPIVFLTDVETIYVKDQEYSFACHAECYPPAEVLWRWKPCKQINVCPLSSDDWTDVNINGSSLNEEFTMEIPGGQAPTSVISYLNVTARQSGHYMCVANNIFGEDDHLIAFIVTEGSSTGSQTAEETSLIFIYVAVGTTIILMIIFCSMYIMLKNKRRKEEFAFLKHNPLELDGSDIYSPNLSLGGPMDLSPYKNTWEFPKDKLKLGKTLGQGAFGRVVKAEAIYLVEGEASTAVAVKMLKHGADSEQRRALIDELKILVHIGRHLNIVNLLGAVTKNLAKGDVYIIMEYCCYGNLRDFLLKHKDKFIDQLDHRTGQLNTKISNLPSSALWNMGQYHEEYLELKSVSDTGILVLPNLPGCSVNEQSNFKSPSVMSPVEGRNKRCEDESDNDLFITTCDLLCFSFQCARGMEYLASRKLIHRDLAARNVLLAKDNVVKICDFGLAKDCYKYSNYIKKSKGLLPIKWMAIESIQDKVFTSKSDVWSFGVLLWELFTLGGTPYAGVEINEEFAKKLKNGYRMEKPKLVLDTVYQLMKNCWLEDPIQRPEFSYLAESIGALLEAGFRKYFMELSTPYRRMNEESFNDTDNFQNVEEYLNMDSSSSK